MFGEDFAELVAELLPEGWEYQDEYGMDGLLTCPCGYQIEQDGRCPNGCVSPLIRLGLV